MLRIDPAALWQGYDGPVLALFGGDDDVVPAQTSLAAFAEHLPPNPAGHGFVVFPGANHGLFVADPDPDVERRDQLASGYLPILAAFFAARAGEHAVAA